MSPQLVIVTDRVATGINNDQFLSTAPGMATSDPTKADNSCLTTPNNRPVPLMRQSPIFTPTNFSFAGRNVGNTQYIDAFQRAQFWKVIDRSTYHMTLSPITTLAPVVVHVPPASGLSIPASFFGVMR